MQQQILLAAMQSDPCQTYSQLALAGADAPVCAFHLCSLEHGRQRGAAHTTWNLQRAMSCFTTIDMQLATCKQVPAHPASAGQLRSVTPVAGDEAGVVHQDCAVCQVQHCKATCNAQHATSGPGGASLLAYDNRMRAE